MSLEAIGTKNALLREMLRIRITEEQIAQRYAERKMRCPVHLSIGQEAPAAAFSLVTTRRDYAVSSHRAHSHFLAKGGRIDELIAELHGKITGCSKGAGGSMHLADRRVRFMGSSAIVGNSIPVGVGLGLATVNERDAVSWVFLGDAATEEGVFYESVNFAALRKLPVIFFCENNDYSVYSDVSVRRPPGNAITKIAESLGCAAIQADGSDPLACLTVITEARKRVSEGLGPILLEFSVFRQREHCGPNLDDHLGYRPQLYVENGFKQDPIARLGGLYSPEDFLTQRAKYSEEISAELERAFDSAEIDGWLLLSDAETFVYA